MKKLLLLCFVLFMGCSPSEKWLVDFSMYQELRSYECTYLQKVKIASCDEYSCKVHLSKPFNEWTEHTVGVGKLLIFDSEDQAHGYVQNIKNNEEAKAAPIFEKYKEKIEIEINKKYKPFQIDSIRCIFFDKNKKKLYVWIALEYSGWTPSGYVIINTHTGRLEYEGLGKTMLDYNMKELSWLLSEFKMMVKNPTIG